MIITEIKRKGKSELYYVYVNDEFFGLLQAEQIYKYKLKSGNIYSLEYLNGVKAESDLLTCKTKALDYVSKSLKSEKQVKDYLKRYGFCDEAINEAIIKLKDYGYINDEQYAKSVVCSLQCKKGKRAIMQDLAIKGIKKEQISAIVDNLSNQSQTCLILAKKWQKTHGVPQDKKDKAKLYRFLVGKGFEFDDIKTTISQLEIGEDDDWY